MRILAIIAMRNEADYITRCISYLVRQGIQVAVIDNASEDDSLARVKRFSKKDVVLVDSWDYPGYYDWRGILGRKEEIRKEIGCDWAIHHDADEIMESCHFWEGLAAGIRRADAQGYDAINFDEFVFVPARGSRSYEGADYYKQLKSYYFFQPSPQRLMRAFRNRLDLSNVQAGGHALAGGQVRIFPENFVLRHYICLSAEHAARKYLDRVYSPEELARGWHNNRVIINERNLLLPDRSTLDRLSPLPWQRFSRRRPRTTHFWQWAYPESFDENTSVSRTPT